VGKQVEQKEKTGVCERKGIIMLGAIGGDIIGSIYEHYNIKTVDFPLFSEYSSFTDDTVLSVAIADSILHNIDFIKKLKEYYFLYPNAGYGASFHFWARSERCEPYNSWGNGSAMRVSPVGYAYDTVEGVQEMARKSAAVTHNHPEGIKGAQATASAIFLAKQGEGKKYIRKYIEKTYQYKLDEKTEDIRRYYTFDISCQGSVPQSIMVFLDSEDYEDAVRKAVSIGGDSDTIACITGGIAEAYYKKMPQFIIEKVFDILDNKLRNVVNEFCAKYLHY